MNGGKIIAKAEPGDVTALIETGESYLGSSTINDYKSAFNCFVKAAELGSKLGALRAAATAIDLANTYQLNNYIEDALNYWQAGMSFSMKVISDANEGYAYFDSAVSALEQSLYGNAACLYMCSDSIANANLKAISSLELIGNRDSKANLLLAVCKFSDQMQTQDDVNQVLTIFENTFRAGSQYMDADFVAALSTIDQTVLGEATIAFAQILRKGIAVEPNPARPTQITATVYNLLSNETVKNTLRNYL